MDEESKKAFEAVYGRVDQLSSDLLGGKDKPGVFEALRSVAAQMGNQNKSISQLGREVRGLAWQQVETQNHVKLVNKRLEAGDARFSALEKDVSALKAAPGREALTQAESWRTWRRNLAMYLLLGFISGSYGWWLGQHHLFQAAVPPSVATAPQGESK